MTANELREAFQGSFVKEPESLRLQSMIARAVIAARRKRAGGLYTANWIGRVKSVRYFQSAGYRLYLDDDRMVDCRHDCRGSLCPIQSPRKHWMDLKGREILAQGFSDRPDRLNAIKLTERGIYDLKAPEQKQQGLFPGSY